MTTYLRVIPAAGDVKAKSKARVPGVDSQAEMKMQVVDYATFDGGLGFELGKGDFTLGRTITFRPRNTALGMVCLAHYGMSFNVGWLDN